MKRFIQSAAEDDVLHQVEWYAEQGVADVARRFRGAVLDAMDALMASPAAGSPKPLANPLLAGLRTWPVHGFADFRVYYLVQPGLVTVIRILHGKRDIEAILERQDLERPDRH